MAGKIEHDNNLPAAGVPAAWTRFLAAALRLVNFADQMRVPVQHSADPFGYRERATCLSIGAARDVPDMSGSCVPGG
jgi:hypothetical protein